MRALWLISLLCCTAMLTAPATAGAPAAPASGAAPDAYASGDDPNPYPSGQQIAVEPDEAARMRPNPGAPTSGRPAPSPPPRSSDGSADRSGGGDDPNPNPAGSDNPDPYPSRSTPSDPDPATPGERCDLPVWDGGGNNPCPMPEGNQLLPRTDPTAPTLPSSGDAPQATSRVVTGGFRGGAVEAAVVVASLGEAAVWFAWADLGEDRAELTIAYVMNGTVVDVDVLAVPGLTTREAARVAQRLLFEFGRTLSQN